jgi:Putative Flp pilus-assembly TadE/G-like
MKSLGNERGQTLIVAAISLTVLLGFAAFGTDVGVQLRDKRMAQTAADSAAIAAASALYAGGNETAATAAGQKDASLNGFTNNSNGTVVTINTPVTDDANPAFNGVSGVVEAIITQPASTPFMNAFMHLFNPASTFTGLTVGARAVARLAPGNACIYTLGTSGIDIDGSGGETLIDQHCGIIDDSSSAGALTLSGGAQVNVATIGIVAATGAVSDSGNSSTDASVVYTGIAYESDPLAYLDSEEPSSSTSGLTCANDPNPSGNGTNKTINPSGPVACYNGITASGGAILNITNPGVILVNGSINISGNSTINFGSGLYVFTGQFNASGGDTASGTNVTFYAACTSCTASSPSNAGGSYNISGGASLSLQAPTTGTYNGILFWQAQGDTNPITVSGGAASTVDGTIYAPSALLNLSGNTGTNFYTDIVVDSMNLSGSSSLHNYNALTSVTDPIKALQLAE